MISTAVSVNKQISGWVDHLLPAALRVSGRHHFITEIIPALLDHHMLVWDVGGGSLPAVHVSTKQQLGLTVVGLDLNKDALAEAPHGAYDRLVCADLTRFEGSKDADLAICQAVLEHVNDTPAALRALASIVRPGGKIAVFVPCRNAFFARLNLALPEAAKRRVLFTLFPEKEVHSGHPARYHRCTPHRMLADAAAAGLQLERLDVYWHSTYLSAFAPAWTVWRLWSLIMWATGSDQMCETFSMVLSKPSG